MIFFFRYLNEFLEEFYRVLATKLKCANENAEESQKLFDDLSNELQKLEKTRKQVNKIKINRLGCSFNKKYFSSELHVLITDVNICH